MEYGSESRCVSKTDLKKSKHTFAGFARTAVAASIYDQRLRLGPRRFHILCFGLCLCFECFFFFLFWFSFTVDRRPSERSSGRDKFRIYQQYNERRRFLSGSSRAVCGATVFFCCFCAQTRSAEKKNRFWCNMRNACKSQPASQPAKNAPKIENAMLNSFYRIYDLKCILLIVYRILMSIFCASTNKFRARYATEKKLKGGKTEQTMLFFGWWIRVRVAI